VGPLHFRNCNDTENGRLDPKAAERKGIMENWQPRRQTRGGDVVGLAMLFLLIIIGSGLIWLTVHYAATIDGWHF
jgi:hypothetical protein